MPGLLPLPLITPDLPGTGGVIKTRPRCFQVEEIPLYHPCGRGEHIYLCLRREGQTTRRLQQELARRLGLAESAVGFAGLKDKQALTTQVFSLHLPGGDPRRVARQVAESLPVEVLWAERHTNKLRRGHLLGNRFRIFIAEPGPQAASCARAVLEALERRGLPNYFGPQRFGLEGDNAARGRQALLGRGPRQKWLRRLLLSAYQGELFNRWLALRIQRGWFGRLLAGDLAKKTDTGGMFLVDDPAREQPRLEAHQITYTGPIFGAKMRPAREAAGELEQEVLAAEDLAPGLFKRARLQGSRRPARIRPQEVSLEEVAGGLWLSFRLPKGAYATVLLREVMKPQREENPATEPDPL